jgi:hypothetical protein
MAGKEETPKCRKKTVTRTNEMIEALIDFIEIHPIVSFHLKYFIDKSIGLDNRLCLCKSSPTTRWNN